MLEKNFLKLFTTFNWRYLTENGELGEEADRSIHIHTQVYTYMLITTLHRFFFWKFSYSLKCICNQKFNSLLIFTITHSRQPSVQSNEEKNELVDFNISRWCEQGDYLHFCFYFYSTNKYPYYLMFSAVFILINLKEWRREEVETDRSKDRENKRE